MEQDNKSFLEPTDSTRSPTLTIARMRRLLQQATPPAVTMTLPLDPTQQSGQHAHLTLKNLVAEAHRELETWPHVDARSLLEGVHRLVEEDEWWRGPGSGYVVLLAPDGIFEHFHVSETLPADVTVGQQFAVRTLLTALHGVERFFVLAISQNHAQLYAGDRYGLRPSTTALSPNSLADALRYFEHSNDLNRHGGGQPGGTGRPFAGVHGQGSQRDSRKSELQEYFRRVDEAVCGIIGGADDGPLVLAIDAPEFPIYRDVSRHPNLLDDIVAGNPDHLTDDELHRRAWTAVASRFEQDRESAIAEYRNSIGTSRCSTFMSDIVSASATGRVATIFVGNDRPAWGRVSDETGRVVIDGARRAGDEELVNGAIAQTLMHGGMAYGQVDLGVHSMAALYRY